MINILKKYNLLPNNIDTSSIIYSFILINFAFLYHTLCFMWGNHDVHYVKEKVLLSSSLFEGRFTQFIPYVLLTQGQILPILNNVISFIFLTLGLWVLAKYWNIKKSKLNYILFITFFSTQPYTLSWLYFSLNTISCLLWLLVAILGLHLSSYIYKQNKKTPLFITSFLCFYLTLGGYPPIINTIFVCLSAKILILYAFENTSLKNILNQITYPILIILTALICYKITFIFIPLKEVYNLQTVQPNEIFTKLISTILITFKQFIITQPFMEKGYKIVLLTMSIISIVATILQQPNIQKKLLTTLLIFITILCASTSTFIASAPTQYVSRIDFYGFALLYPLFFSLLLKISLPIAQSIGIIFMIILIPFNIINDYRALKIWKQGFDAEFQILDRIVERIENHPKFNPSHQYRFLQIGDVTLRPAYYHEKYDVNEPFLFSLPYLAMWQGKNLIDFFSAFEYIAPQPEVIISDINNDLLQFMQNEAQTWPHPNSIYINDNIIVLIFREKEKNEIITKIQKTLSSS